MAVAITSSTDNSRESGPAAPVAGVRRLALRPLVARAAQALLRWLWLAVIPALLAGVASRYLVPRAADPAGAGLASAVAKLAIERPVELAVALFVALAALSSYWRFYLPGGRFLAKLPLEVAASAPRAALAELESAARVERLLAKPVERASAELREGLLQEVERLRAGLRAGNAAAATSASNVLSAAFRPQLRTRQVVQAGLFVASMALALFGAHVIRANWLLYRVLSSSMLPAFQVDDVLIGSRSPQGLALPPFIPLKAGALPRRGDVIVFHDTTGSGPEYLIKRVVGLPGDEIIMHSGRAFINRWLVPDCDAGAYANLLPGAGYVSGRLAVEFLDGAAYLTVHTALRKQWKPYVVQPGEVFVLGDNRNSSIDSRTWQDHGGSGVPVSEIVARVDRSLVHSSRTGQAVWDTLLQPTRQLNLNLDGLNASNLESGIRRCLAKRPQQTTPPALDASLPEPAVYPSPASITVE